jgi:hypothetical protein
MGFISTEKERRKNFEAYQTVKYGRVTLSNIEVVLGYLPFRRVTYEKGNKIRN